jgi:hypothetical protein
VTHSPRDLAAGGQASEHGAVAAAAAGPWPRRVVTSVGGEGAELEMSRLDLGQTCLVGAGALGLAAVLSLLACQSGGSGGSASSKGDKQAALVTKPFAQLTQNEVGALCEKLGWSNSGVTSSGSGDQSNIMASCTKESPDGSPSPDGKKRLRMRVAVYKETPAGIEPRKKDLDGDHGAYEVQGSTVLGVVVYDKPKDAAAEVLSRLLGK